MTSNRSIDLLPFSFVYLFVCACILLCYSAHVAEFAGVSSLLLLLVIWDETQVVRLVGKH